MTEQKKHGFRYWAAVLAGGLIGLALIGLLVLMLPSVQRWAVVKALESPGVSRIEVGRVRLYPGSFLIQDLTLEKDGMMTRIDQARGEGALWKALFGRPVRIRDYQVEGWFLRIALTDPESGEFEGVPIEAALALAPFALELDQISLNGRIEVVNGEGRVFAWDMVGEGNGFGPNRTGEVRLTGPVEGFYAGAPAVPGKVKVAMARSNETEIIQLSISGSLGGGAAPLLFSAVVGVEPAMLKVEGVLDLDLPGLERLMVAGDQQTFSSGRAGLSFSVVSNQTGEAVIDGRLEAEGIELADTGYRIDRIEAPLRTVLLPGNSLTFRTPVEVVRPDFHSDFVIALTAVADDPGWRVAGSLTGERIVVEDLAVLGALFRLPADPGGVDSNPAWHEFIGRFELDFRRVRLKPGLWAEGLRAEVTVAPDQLSVQGLDAEVAEGTIHGGLVVIHDEAQLKPYRLESGWVVKGVEIGTVLGAVAAGPGLIDGPFNMTLNLSADTSDLREVTSFLRGDLALEGGPGVFRGLAEHVRKASSLASAVGSLFRSDRLQTVVDLSSNLAAIDYDRIRLNLTRTMDSGLELERIQLQGPEVKLAGQGRIGTAETVDLLHAPMLFEFRLGAKGAAAVLLGELGLTSIGRIDGEGYRIMAQPFSIGGTPSEPDVSGLWSILRQAAIGRLLGGDR